MISKIIETLQNDCDLAPGSTLLVGVSGGADSVSLAHVLVESGYQIVIAHLNHGLREEAAEDEKFVEKFAEEHGFSFTSAYTDTGDFAEEYSLSIEEAARELRYGFLFEQAEAYMVDAVAVAHTADDQVETVLMHLLRGSGLDGLVGMKAYWESPWHPEIPLVRPMLGVWREEIDAYCQQNGLDTRFDHSNLDTTFFRNRLRQNLIPELTTYNPNIKTLLWQMSDTLSADQDVLENMVNTMLPAMRVEQSEDHVALAAIRFRGLSLGLQRRVLRQVISELRPGLRDVDYGAVERAITIIRQDQQKGQTDLGAGLRLQMEQDRILIVDGEEEIPHPDWPWLEWDDEIGDNFEEIELSEAWQMRLTELSLEQAEQEGFRENTDLFTAYLDAATLSSSLLVRGRQVGDRFQPLGMAGHSQKLADFMINAKIPPRARARLPLVCATDKIVWVPGVRIAHPHRVKENTKSILKISIFRTIKE